MVVDRPGLDYPPPVVCIACLACLLGPRAHGPYSTSLNYRTLAQARAGLGPGSMIKIVKFKDNPNGKLLRCSSIFNGRSLNLLSGTQRTFDLAHYIYTLEVFGTVNLVEAAAVQNR
jgi:hypothetical protein